LSNDSSFCMALEEQGKTQLSLQFIKTYHDRYRSIFFNFLLAELECRYRHVFFVDASSEECIKASFEDVGKELHLPQPSDIATCQWFSRQMKPWLLLFDNADNADLNLHRFLPECKQGTIIITICNHQCIMHVPDLHNWNIGDMSHEDAVKLLYRASCRTANTDLDATKKLVDQLSCFALAVSQAAGFLFMNHNKLFTWYLSHVKKRPKLVFENHSKECVHNLGDIVPTASRYISTTPPDIQLLGQQGNYIRDILLSHRGKQ